MMTFISTSQNITIRGTVSGDNGPLPYSSIQLENTNFGSSSDSEGNFILTGVPPGEYTLLVTFVGYETYKETLRLEKNKAIRLNPELKKMESRLDDVVITGTRTAKKIHDSPVMVGIIDRRTLENVQACNLSEGLRFQPGLRVETNCQTCNYTQLRMNGLGGGYSQILVNGRPTISPLTGLYSLEQMPANMIERIEVVRGGGSALYGSSAIGGTVNVISRLPVKDSYELSYTYQNIAGTDDQIIIGNATKILSENKSGVSVFINRRNRGFYDHNRDGFSELPRIDNNAIGSSFYYKPTENQKLEVNLSGIHEYRIGGEMLDKEVHLLKQAEERTHKILIANADYQINFNDGNSSLISYLAYQLTDRQHYTGIFPDDSSSISEHLINPPYGSSMSTTFQAGSQINNRFNSFFIGSNVITLGAEYTIDDVLDIIPSYDYKIDQRTLNLGVFAQSDWQLSEKLDLLLGLRLDKHNLVADPIINPRISFMYSPWKSTQFRLTWGNGFRAPQAFDSDMHIAFAGGGVSRIRLSPDLMPERSRSYSASVNFDKPTDHYIIGYTIETFYTELNDAFFLQPVGRDIHGLVFEKQNGQGARVQGLTLEIRANYDGKYQIEGGFTWQQSLYELPVQNIQGLESRREFLRTPNEYGYSTLTINATRKWSNSFNLVHTGSMVLAHFAGAPENSSDNYTSTPSFTEISFRTAYKLTLGTNNNILELFGGIKNITNAYQNDFDSGKNRDSNYIYGPPAPRTFYLGLKFASL
ncbi:MAG: TonB-dependent receptor [Vicingaceae bacterium]